MIHEIFISPEELRLLIEVLGQEILSARVTGWNAEVQVGSRILHIFPGEVVVPVSQNSTREFYRPKLEFSTRFEQATFEETLSAPFRVESLDVLTTLVAFTPEIIESVVGSSTKPITISSYGPEYFPPSEARRIDADGRLAGLVDIGIEMKNSNGHSIVFFTEAYSVEYSLDALPADSEWVTGRAFVRRPIERQKYP